MKADRNKTKAKPSIKSKSAKTKEKLKPTDKRSGAKAGPKVVQRPAWAKSIKKNESKPIHESAGKPTPKTVAKDRALAGVEALLRSPLENHDASASSKAQAHRTGATAHTLRVGEPSRFDRCLQRAEKGEPGPIKIADLDLNTAIIKAAKESEAIDSYRKILQKNPSAQPGRPLVNIEGNSDKDLRFVVLSLPELVLAAQEIGRETLQVSLVRLNKQEAEALARASNAPAPQSDEIKTLSPHDVALTNGFMELPLKEIIQSENVRHSVDTESQEFQNLVESIRTIGLQNAPVVEVRPIADQPHKHHLVCISGHRRLLALDNIGVEHVTCALKLFKSEKHRMLATLAENINREDLHFLDKADGYGGLAAQGMSAGEIASLLDSDQRTIAKYLRASQWDGGIKKRVRDLGAKATTRFLLNYLAAGERTTAELHAMLDKYEAASNNSGDKPKRSSQKGVRQKLDDFYSFSDYSSHEKALIEKALKFLGVLR